MSRTMLASLGAGIAQNVTGAVAPHRAGTIYLTGTVTPVPIYAGETGGATLSTDGTFTTDGLGRVPGWVDVGLEVDVTVPPADPVTCITQAATGPVGPVGPQGPQGPAGMGFDVIAKTTSYTILVGDSGNLITFNGANKTATLPAAAPAEPWAIGILNLNATPLTISPNGLQLQGSGSSITIAQNQHIFIWSDGTNYFVGGQVPPSVVTDSRGAGAGADVPMNAHKVTGLADATAATDALNRQSGDARFGQLAVGNVFMLPTGQKQSFRLSNPVTMTTGGAGAYTFPANTDMTYADEWGNFVACGGLRTSGGSPGTFSGSTSAPFFLVQASTGRMYTASAAFVEVGDPPDVSIGRFGGVYPFGSGAGPTFNRLGVLSGDSLGVIYWRGACTPVAGTPGVTTGATLQGQSASIYARAAENAFAASSGGHLYFSTTPIGAAVVSPRLVIRANGHVLVMGNATSDNVGDSWASPGDLVGGSNVYAIGRVHAKQDPGNGAEVKGVTIGDVGPANQAGIAFASAMDTVLYRDSAGALRTASSLRVDGGITGTTFPGSELAYAQITATVSALSATTAATANDLGLTTGAVTYDGNPVMIEFFCPKIDRGSNSITIVLYDGSTQLGNLGTFGAASSGCVFKTRITPSAGSHTYLPKAFVDAGSGQVEAGTGAAGSQVPAYFRITRV